MSPARFCRFELRTTAIAAAREFYLAVLGDHGDAIVELPAAAAARGAPPHWLGYVGVGHVGGVESVAQRFIARGATRLGTPAAGAPAILRDPGGAVLGLMETSEPTRARVLWYQLNTAEASRTALGYVELFGWALTERIELGTHGWFQLFAWRANEPSVGSIGDLEGRPFVHPHWLFFFGIASLDPTLALVRERGGNALEMRLRDGVRAALCHDAQGAAFGLIEESAGM